MGSEREIGRGDVQVLGSTYSQETHERRSDCSRVMIVLYVMRRFQIFIRTLN